MNRGKNFVWNISSANKHRSLDNSKHQIPALEELDFFEVTIVELLYFS